MAEPTQSQLGKFISGISVRQVRLACGLVLFTYLISHFVNHALGNVSMDALAAGVYFHTRFWQFPPVGMAFYAAALAHTGLGIWALYERRQFRYTATEITQPGQPCVQLGTASLQLRQRRIHGTHRPSFSNLVA